MLGSPFGELPSKSVHFLVREATRFFLHSASVVCLGGRKWSLAWEAAPRFLTY